jgi:hypothetical protein
MSTRCGLVVLVLLICTAVPGWAQEAQPDTLEAWQYDLRGKFNASQAAYNNWQEGGLNALQLNTTLDGSARQEGEHWIQTHKARLAYGLLQQDTLDVRKSEDLIRMESTLRYQGDHFFRVFNPTLAAGLRTQFAEGFNYDKDPLDRGDDPPVKTSDFFSPATFTESIGLTYEADSWFSQRLSFASKQTIVMIDRLRPLYGVDPDGPVRLEAGAESVTTFDRNIFENVRLQSSLNLFLAFNQPGQPDMIWENLITMKVNSWMNVDLEFVAVYNEDISSAVQIKEVLSVGVVIDII